MFGFGRKKHEEVLCGGTTDMTDHNAAKVIYSKEIRCLSADFALTGEWVSGTDFAKCDFEIKPDESGTLIACEREMNLSFEADTELLTKLQSIIDEQKLAGKNGLYRVTAGLPPEYQPCTLKVDYASGERLTFTENNDPDAAWAKQMYLAFADWFAKKGDASMLPPDPKEQITRLSVNYRENGIVTRYSDIRVGDNDAINGEHVQFHKSVWDSESQKTVCKKFTLFPNDFFDKVTDIVNSFDLRPFDRCSVLYGTGRTHVSDSSSDKQLADLRLHIEYINGHRLYINTNDENDKAILKPLLGDLFSYFDSLFEK